jgi:hypothetical protein
MDMKETSAMTEASGLVNRQNDVERASEAVPRNEREMGGKRPPDPRSGPRLRFHDQLRKMTVEAPLPSLMVAFLLGILVARRR